jgi:hypothetical protein
MISNSMKVFYPKKLPSLGGEGMQPAGLSLLATF